MRLYDLCYRTFYGSLNRKSHSWTSWFTRPKTYAPTQIDSNYMARVSLSFSKYKYIFRLHVFCKLDNYISRALRSYSFCCVFKNKLNYRWTFLLMLSVCNMKDIHYKLKIQFFIRTECRYISIS